MSTDKVEGAYIKRSSRWKLILVALIVALVVTIIASLNIGYASISFSEILDILGKQIPFLSGSINSASISPTSEAIIIQIRLPRVLAGALVGAGAVVTHDVPADGVVYGVPARAALLSGVR